MTTHKTQSRMEYLTENEKVDDEIAQRRSIEKFLMDVIYPKLKKETQEAIKKSLTKGLSVTAAFEFARVDIKMCIRK